MYAPPFYCAAEYPVADVLYKYLFQIQVQKQWNFERVYYFLGAFFLPATVLRLPFLVRLLVRVRCPRSGKPLR